MFTTFCLLSTGHYISDVYRPGNNLWKSYDDSTITEVISVLIFNFSYFDVLIFSKQMSEVEVRQRRQTCGYIFFYVNKWVT